MCLIRVTEDLSGLNSELTYLSTSLSYYTEIIKYLNVSLCKVGPSVQKDSSWSKGKTDLWTEQILLLGHTSLNLE